MPEKTKQSEAQDEDVELETQIILRLPEEPAKVLGEAIDSGANNLKDRLAIKIDPDMRHGEVRLDHWLMHAKILDLPTIIEALKTIDNKSFYKTADICQLMLCKEEPDLPSADEESPNKGKKKDPTKVDKKFLWPHGITPPCKNIRKRRFRKTLKKKYVEAPEIEKEVKRLLRVDNEAVNVKYEIINEDEEQGKLSGVPEQSEETIENEIKPEIQIPEEDVQKQDSQIDISAEAMSSQPASRGVGEHDIFGEEVSSSEDEDNNVNVIDTEEQSRLSADDSQLSELSGNGSNLEKITEFDKSMFNSPKSQKEGLHMQQISSLPQCSLSYEQQDNPEADDNDFSEPQMSREQINARIFELRKQSEDLKAQQSQKAMEISSIQNPTLRQRMQETLDGLLSQIFEKDLEIQLLQAKLNN